MSKATMKIDNKITKPLDMKLNVLPVFGALIHDYAYEGPCRFGAADELTKEFDTMATAAGFKAFQQRLDKDYHDNSDINMLQAQFIACSDEFSYKPEQFTALEKMMGEVDVILVFANAMPRMCRELKSRFGKPMIVLTNSGAITLSVLSDLLAKGYEDVYGPIDWAEANRYMRAMKVAKALGNTRILKLIRHETPLYLTADFDIDPKIINNRWGVQETSINLHEMMDQLREGDGSGNYTLPLRTVNNLTLEESAEAESITKDLIAGADECWMDEDKIVKSVRFNVLTRKLMEHFGCNAFTAQCKECCATTRINEDQVTFCMGHSLNNECGIASSCEGDVNALVAITVLSCLSRKAPYMSNTNPLVLADGKIVASNWFSDHPCVEKYPDELYCTWHATPNRYMKGYDEDPAQYAIGPFASNARFGATIRYKFEEDAGEDITLMRFNPAGTKMIIFKGTIVGGTGYERYGCPEGIYFRLKNRDAAFKAQLEFGNHMPLVYGDYVKDLKTVAEILGVETVIFE